MRKYRRVIHGRSGDNYKILVYYEMHGRRLEYEAEIVCDNLLHDTHLVSAWGWFDGKQFRCYVSVKANLVSEEAFNVIMKSENYIKRAVQEVWCKEVRQQADRNIIPLLD